MSGSGEFFLESEKLRLYGYFGFGFLVAVGVFLTTNFAEVDFTKTVLNEVFGYNNICVYFDHPPSNYVLPVLWVPVMCSFLLVLFAQWMQFLEEKEKGELSPTAYFHFRNLKVFEGISFLVFTDCFAVSPTDRKTLWIHTSPFILLQLALVSTALTNTIHGTYFGYYERLGFSKTVITCANVYAAVFVLIVAFKIPYTINAMAGQPLWEHSPTFMLVAKVVDQLFTVCAVIIPLCKALYLRMFKHDLLHKVHLKAMFDKQTGGRSLVPPGPLPTSSAE